MQIFYRLEEIPPDFGPSLVSVGNFDGVHRAHLRVLAELIVRSRQTGAKSVAVTFEPHPMRILRPDSALKLLTPTPEKLRLLEQTGIDAVLLLPFTRDLSLMGSRDFVQQIICNRLNAIEVHEGYNFRFGHKAAGNVELLSTLGRELSFQVVVYPEMRLRGESVSSTRIRELVQRGDVGRARTLLGRSFSIQSTPGRGRGYGAKYTVPTINLSRYEELVPGDGVYVTRTRIGTECFDSVSNVGNRPTFGSESYAIETHLLDFHPLELTAETPVELSFLARVRDEVKFDSIEALRQQIGRDVKKAQHYFALMRSAKITA
ncbi:MAG: bifunctional riboflavin kinase/FMN adenylyltransferase [Acidobacteria bacterium]|nr:MAG: bifunctional riboflavin kinase/FMN adenylyltransferase [Acidobacteriota bacterium]